MENVMNQDASVVQMQQENKPLPTDCILCSIVWFQVILSCCLIVDGVLCGVLMKNEFYWISIAAVAIGGGLLSAGVALFNYIASKDLDNPCKLASIIIIGGVTGGFWLTAVCVLSVAIKRSNANGVVYTLLVMLPVIYFFQLLLAITTAIYCLRYRRNSDNRAHSAHDVNSSTRHQENRPREEHFQYTTILPPYTLHDPSVFPNTNISRMQCSFDVRDLPPPYQDSQPPAYEEIRSNQSTSSSFDTDTNVLDEPPSYTERNPYTKTITFLYTVE